MHLVPPPPCNPPPLQSPPPHLRDHHLAQKALEMLGSQEKFSLSYTRISGGRPSLGDCLPSPPPPPGDRRALGGEIASGCRYLISWGLSWGQLHTHVSQRVPCSHCSTS